jgi:hypothetical protein
MYTTACLLTVAAIFAGWEGVTLWRIHSDGIDAWSLETRHSAVEVADILETNLWGMDEQLSRIVPLAEQGLAGKISEKQLLEAMGAGMERARQIAFFAVFDAAGNLVTASDPGLKRQKVTARRRDFLAYFAGGEQGRHVTASYLSGPSIDRSPPMRLLISRRLSAEDGSLAGVAVAAMAPDYLLQTLVDPGLYLDKDVRLFLENGKLLAVHGDGSEKVGENFGTRELFQTSGPASSAQWGVLPGPFDDTPEIAALQSVASFPFMVSVATSNGPELTGWWVEPAFLLGYAGLSAIGVMVFLVKGLWTEKVPYASPPVHFPMD